MEGSDGGIVVLGDVEMYVAQGDVGWKAMGMRWRVGVGVGEAVGGGGGQGVRSWVPCRISALSTAPSAALSPAYMIAT